LCQDTPETHCHSQSRLAKGDIAAGVPSVSHPVSGPSAPSGSAGHAVHVGPTRAAWMQSWESQFAKSQNWAAVQPVQGVVMNSFLPSPGWHCHSTLTLTVIDCHSFRIYTLILLSLLSFSVKMTVSPSAILALGDGVEEIPRHCVLN
jgi:hypothetical protein